MVREASCARGVILIVNGGIHGSGFSVQGDIDMLRRLPMVLREVALEIEASVEEEIRRVQGN